MKDDFIEQVGYERLLDTLRQERNVELAVAVLSVRADDETQGRYDDLADRHSEGRLTNDELRELELLVRRNLQVSELKAEAQKCFNAQSV